MKRDVMDHYGSQGIVPRLLAAVGDRGGAALTALDLYPYDQFHGRELAATRDHAALLAPLTTDRVLDIGSGIGGPARYIGVTFGCDVTGIDVTPSFVDSAQDLTALCGMADRVRFVLGDAGAMPFAAQAFDRACCLYVGMNLPALAPVLNEAARVLKPGGRLVWSQVTQGTGDPIYPLPWANQPGSSHLIAVAELQDAVTCAGFTLTEVRDETADILAHAAAIKAAGRVPTEDQKQANAVVMGPDFMTRRQNFIAGLASGALQGHVVVAVKDGSAATEIREHRRTPGDIRP